MPDFSVDGTPETSPQRYAIRLTPHATQDSIETAAWIAENIGPDAGERIALEWKAGLSAALATLAENPKRFPAHEDSSLIGSDTRRLLYRRTSRSSMAHHIYYLVDEGGEDAPTVLVFHIRNASRPPISEEEAQELRQEL